MGRKSASFRPHEPSPSYSPLDSRTPSPKTINRGRELNRFGAIHEVMKPARRRSDSDDRSRHRDIDRSRRRESSSSDTETEQHTRPPKKAKISSDNEDDDRDGNGVRDGRSHNHKNNKKERRHRRSGHPDDDGKYNERTDGRSRREDTRPSIPEFSNYGQLFSLLQGLSPEEVKMVQQLSPEHFNLFLRIKGVAGLGPAPPGHDRFQAHAKSSPLKLPVIIHAVETVEGLVAMPDDESQSSDNSDTMRKGDELCRRMEPAKTSVSLEPDFANLRRQFDPIMKAFAGEKISQQVRLWMDTDNAARAQLEGAFADAQAKFNGIQEKVEAALGRIQLAVERKKQLVQEARRDIEELLNKHEKELEHMRTKWPNHLERAKRKCERELEANVPDANKLHKEVLRSFGKYMGHGEDEDEDEENAEENAEEEPNSEDE